MKILAIETSCDETAIALVEASGGLKNPQFKILENLVASQIKIHRPFGGVVPNLAKREHTKNLPILFRKIFGISKSEFLISKQIPNPKPKIQKVDLICVTVGPGLEPALWTGINFAKDLYKTLYPKPYVLNPKLIGVSHLEGHLYSFLLEQKTVNSEFRIQNSELFPAIALIISGGHTILLLMKDLTHYKKLGETRDDAVGEAFDKVARLLDLPYPGGPEIEKLAKKGNPEAISFPRPMIYQKNYDFSFSGLKTAVLYYLRGIKNNELGIMNKKTPPLIHTSKFIIQDIAASFQAAAFDVLISKTLRAAKEFKAKSIMISGGVAANKTLQKQFQSVVASEAKQSQLKIDFLAPAKKFCADNAAMIAVAGYINYLRKKNRRLIANGNLGL
ncbi:MAG: tRNA (adenosine(37)-N6)-threonylcarbamoyltransferase complex transferase subunit TsaD [bacterium]|nr:tRNA (adenosine(37)-N6)-threonylcarbamoyltransferase complex transferase subunit TsaD [bacterium]